MTTSDRERMRAFYDTLGEGEWTRLESSPRGRVVCEVHRRFLAVSYTHLDVYKRQRRGGSQGDRGGRGHGGLGPEGGDREERNPRHRQGAEGEPQGSQNATTITERTSGVRRLRRGGVIRGPCAGGHVCPSQRSSYFVLGIWE